MTSFETSQQDSMSVMKNKEKAWDRFVMIVKPEQSGKTFVMIKKINEFIEEESDKVTVNFIFCDNSLLLTKQTTGRIHSCIHLPDIEESYVELSSRKNGSAKNNSSEVRCAIEDGCRNVVCCTNSTRVSDMVDIIRRINTFNKGGYNFKIWLDEADKFINYIQEKFIPLAEYHNNVEFYMITATPQPIYRKYKEIRTLALENTTDPTYHGWNDCNIKIRDDEAGTTIGFARQIADEMMAAGQLKPGSKGYVPADKDKKTHHKMRDMFISKGVAVFVVNGEGIELSLPVTPNIEPTYQTRIQVKKTEELIIHIRNLYNDHNVHRWSCVVTGNICVGRGISIQQPGFMFDFGILSNCRSKTEASQNAGRMKGNFKNWEGYSTPDVYTTYKFNKIASDYEEQSRKIAVIAFQKKAETDDTALVTIEEVKDIIPTSKRALVFDTFDQANDFTNKHFKKRPRKMVPLELRKEHPDRNPSAKALKHRLWGVNRKTKFRLYPTEDNKYCLYWNKQLVDSHYEDAYILARENQV